MPETKAADPHWVAKCHRVQKIPNRSRWESNLAVVKAVPKLFYANSLILLGAKAKVPRRKPSVLVALEEMTPIYVYISYEEFIKLYIFWYIFCYIS